MIKNIIFLTLLMPISLYATDLSICSIKDSRIQISQEPIARLSKKEGDRGCTATMIGKSCAITAGHCYSNLYRGEFNVEDSIAGKPTPASDTDTYLVDQTTIIHEDKGRGNDWAVFKFNKNEKTALFPGDVYGYYELEEFEPKTNTDELMISGYGTHWDDQSLTFTLLQATGFADYIGYSSEGRTLVNHKIDTTPGSSGSTIINVKTKKIIGIHAQGGCNSSSTIWNSGTLIKGHKKLLSAIRQCLSAE